MTRERMHGLFAGVPEADVRKIVGENFLRAYKVEPRALRPARRRDRAHRRGPGRTHRVIELVVTDLDGSLWVREEIHPATRAAWTELEARGIPVMVATGRRLTTTREPLARAGLTPPAVLLNGARSRSTSRPTNASIAGTTTPRWRRGCSKRSAPLRSIRVCTSSTPRSRSTSARGRRPIRAITASFGPRAVSADLDEIVRTEPILGFGVIGYAHEPLTVAVTAIGDRAEAHLAVDAQWGGSTLTVAPPRAVQVGRRACLLRALGH